MATYTQADAGQVKLLGIPMTKLPSTVYMYRVAGEFAVQTNEGLLTCKDGWVAYDPISGHLWPVSADYVATHYRIADSVQ